MLLGCAQVMRRLGIKQWPYRKRTSAKKITHSLEVGADSVGAAFWYGCLLVSAD